jgi:hypothetical protein
MGSMVRRPRRALLEELIRLAMSLLDIYLIDRINDIQDTKGGRQGIAEQANPRASTPAIKSK